MKAMENGVSHPPTVLSNDEIEFKETYEPVTSLYKLLQYRHSLSPLFLPRNLQYRLVTRHKSRGRGLRSEKTSKNKEQKQSHLDDVIYRLKEKRYRRMLHVQQHVDQEPHEIIYHYLYHHNIKKRTQVVLVHTTSTQLTDVQVDPGFYCPWCVMNCGHYFENLMYHLLSSHSRLEYQVMVRRCDDRVCGRSTMH